MLAGQLLALAAIPCLAQQMPSLGLSAYAGQNVSSVDIAGQPDVTFSSVQHVIAVKQGKPLSEQDVNASVAALKQRGFQGVKLDLQPSADGIQVRFILTPAVYIGMYDFPGALKEFTYTTLLQIANYNAQMPYSATDISQAEDALVQYFPPARLFPGRSSLRACAAEQTIAWSTFSSAPILAFARASARST